MDDDFGVAVGLEDRAFVLEPAAMLAGVGEVAVVAQRELAFVAIDGDGLGVEQGFVAGGGVARVADGQATGKRSENAGLKNFFDFAHGAVELEFLTVARDDAGGFLAAMLQRVKAEIHEIRGFRMAEDAEDTTVVVEVIVENEGPIHQASFSAG